MTWSAPESVQREEFRPELVPYLRLRL
jgi:hypothetical protein